MSLEQVEALVATLDPSDQVRLLERLADRLQAAPPAAKAPCVDPAAAWRALHEIGEKIAAGANGQSIVQEIFDMRR